MSDVKLNGIERLKQQRQASEYRSELVGVDWKNLDEETRFYLKNFGIYNIKLRPEICMIRLRIDGGRITLETLEKIAEIRLGGRSEFSYDLFPDSYFTSDRR